MTDVVLMTEAALLHVAQRVFGHEEEAEDIGAEGALDLPGVDLADVLGLVLLGRVIDQNIETTELPHGLLDRIAAKFLVADVAGHLDRAAALLLDRRDGLIGVLVLLQVNDGDLGAFPRHRHRDRPADAGIATCDQRHLVVEPATTGIFRLIVRLWPHLRFPAGLTFLLLCGLQSFVHGTSPCRRYHLRTASEAPGSAIEFTARKPAALQHRREHKPWLRR